MRLKQAACRQATPPLIWSTHTVPTVLKQEKHQTVIYADGVETRKASDSYLWYFLE